MNSDLASPPRLGRAYLLDGHLVMRLPHAQAAMVQDLTEAELTDLRTAIDARLLEMRAGADRLVRYIADQTAKQREASVATLLAKPYPGPVAEFSYDEIPCGLGGGVASAAEVSAVEPVAPPVPEAAAPVPEAAPAETVSAIDLRPGVTEDIAFLRECGCSVERMPPSVDHFFPRFRFIGPDGGKSVVIEQKELRQRAKTQRRRAAEDFA